MPVVNSDVIIVEHDLILLDAAGNEIGRLDQSGRLRLGAQGNAGVVEVRDGTSQTVIYLGGAGAAIYAGGDGNEGDVIVRDGTGRDVVQLNGGNAGLYVGNDGHGGSVFVQDDAGRHVIQATGDSAWLRVGVAGNEGDIEVQDDGGRSIFHVDGNNAWLRIGATGNEGDIDVQDASGRSVIHADGANAWLRIGAAGNEGDLEVQDSSGRRVFHFNGDTAQLFLGADGNEGDLIVRDVDGNDRIVLDGNSGDIKLMGADLAEDFTVHTPVEPGTVLAAVGLDEVEPTSTAMDRRVVGVASGAGELRPALRLGRKPDEAGRVAVALTGRVYCKADAHYGPIAVGNLLTSSPTVGHAMRVDDHAAAAGAVIGKALGALDRGMGLIPVLVTLH